MYRIEKSREILPQIIHAARNTLAGNKLNDMFHIIYRIEKSREILPQILRAARNTPAGNKLNWLYFYQLLFTRKNLKLVHAVCHDKSGHEDAKCDPGQFYIKA